MFFGPFPPKPSPTLDAIPPSLQAQCQTHTASYLTLIQITAAPSFANFFHNFGRMAGPNKGGHPRGAKNYKNEVLINIIAGTLPNGQYGWDQAAVLLI